MPQGIVSRRGAARAVLTLVALGVGLVAGLAAGGSWRAVGRRRVRLWWLLVPGLGLQVVADRLPWQTAADAVLVAAYLLLLGFVVANRLLVGTGVMAAGLVLNAAVVTVDGGMPVRPAAVVAAGLAPAHGPVPPPTGARHHLQRPGDRLTALDDGVPLAPFHQVVSVGDLVLAVGVADATAHLLLPAASARRRRRAARRTRTRRARRLLWAALTAVVVQPRGVDATRVNADYYGLGRHRRRRSRSSEDRTGGAGAPLATAGRLPEAG